MSPRKLPSDLSTEQKARLHELWKTYHRPIVDVTLTNEARGVSIKEPAYTFILRLTTFLSDLLKAFRGDKLPHLPSEPRQCCLHSFLKLSMKPVTGRHVVPIHHSDFLQMLQTYELNGEEASPEYIRRDSFGAFLYHLPETALAAIGCAMALALQASNDTQIAARFHNVQPQVAMRDIKTGLVGKLVSLHGHVVKTRPKRLRVAAADFTCTKCGQLITHPLEKGAYSVPSVTCPQCSKSRSYTLMRSTARYTNVQELRLQEAPDESTQYAGRTPRQLAVEVEHDLVQTCRPGDSIALVAIVAAVHTTVAAGRKRDAASTFQLYLQGHSITTLSEQRNQTSTSAVYTPAQLERITQLCHADHRYFGLMERRAFPFDLLVHSLCPAIIGHNEVKAGLLLSLLGGTPASAISTTSQSIRSNAHVLIVGDPGMGKSQMLLAASQLAARSVYVGGNTSSTTGLTVTLTREEGGESGIEAGALVLADQGVCCIDEFDKMAKNHQDGLLEAMEQQQVSIAKAGVVASLPARCSLIAAANPKHGSYNMNKTVAENLNMAKPILSRFDLVFILRDRADKDHDRMVSSNIMNLYRGSKQTVDRSAPPQTTAQATGVSAERMPLMDRLSWISSFQKEPLPASLVRDYIAYAREYCKPKLTVQAAGVLRDFFMDLRYPSDGGCRRSNDTVPITTRQLEALIRLCQARAKACLRDFILEEDALDVVELMRLSVHQVHADESGILDPIRGGAGGQSRRKLKKAFVLELHRVVGIGAECTLDDLRRIAHRVQCGLSEFQPVLDDLRDNGILMKRSNGRYQVLT